VLLRTMRGLAGRELGLSRSLHEQSSPVSRCVGSAMAVLGEARTPPGYLGVFQDEFYSRRLEPRQFTPSDCRQQLRVTFRVPTLANEDTQMILLDGSGRSVYFEGALYVSSQNTLWIWRFAGLCLIGSIYGGNNEISRRALHAKKFRCPRRALR
jgi:hypothetical protein